MGSALSRKEIATLTALKVRVSMSRDSGNPDFKGAWAAGVWFPAGDIVEVELTSDEGATGVLQVDEETHEVKKLSTLEMKLNQLYILEGRQRNDFGAWSEPGFELVTEQGGDFSSNPRPPKRGPRAPILAKVTILDRRDKSGVWASELAARAAKAGNKAAETAK